MALQITSSSRKRRPKPGTGFLLVRLAGWFLMVVGGLLIVSALVGFVVMLVKTGSTLIGALEAFEEKMAGFIALVIVGGLLTFVLLGLGGAILAGIGFAFNRWGTEPVVAGSVAESVAQILEQTSKDSG